MKVATKIVSGYAVLIALMAGLFVYQVILIHRMQSINRNLSRINFRAARISVDMIRDRDLVEEYARKSFALGDPDYIAKLEEFVEDFETSLRDMELLGRSESQRTAIESLSRSWGDFTSTVARERRRLRPGMLRELPPGLVEYLETLRAQVQTVHQATLRSIDAEVVRSAETGQKAEWISWSAAGLALLLSCIISFLIVRSITEPLKNLTAGTRAIADGKFFYRLDTSRDDEFAQLAKDFNTMTRRLNELDKLKKDFVSHVSHELKAPLASMQETIQMLLGEIPGPLTEKQERLLRLNLQSGKRLSAMIANLLDLSRMEMGVMEYELKSEDLAVLVRTAISEFEVQAREKDLQIVAELPGEPLMVDCDGDRIIQILSNLLGNAVKFSPGQAAIGVRAERITRLPDKVPAAWRHRVEADADKSAFAVVAISDSGPGVPDEHKEKIFEKFHQVKQGQKIKGQGVGLGLAICRTIVETHRGALWVEDNPAGGSVFSLLLRLGSKSREATYRASSPI